MSSEEEKWRDRAVIGIALIFFGLIVMGQFDWRLAIGMALFYSGKRFVFVANERINEIKDKPAQAPCNPKE